MDHPQFFRNTVATASRVRRFPRVRRFTAALAVAFAIAAGLAFWASGLLDAVMGKP